MVSASLRLVQSAWLQRVLFLVAPPLVAVVIAVSSWPARSDPANVEVQENGLVVRVTTRDRALKALAERIGFEVHRPRTLPTDLQLRGVFSILPSESSTGFAMSGLRYVGKRPEVSATIRQSSSDPGVPVAVFPRFDSGVSGLDVRWFENGPPSVGPAERDYFFVSNGWYYSVSFFGDLRSDGVARAVIRDLVDRD